MMCLTHLSHNKIPDRHGMDDKIAGLYLSVYTGGVWEGMPFFSYPPGYVWSVKWLNAPLQPCPRDTLIWRDKQACMRISTYTLK